MLFIICTVRDNTLRIAMANFFLTLILPDIRSAQNVGSIFRTADAAGVERIITAGYTPHPAYPGDPRPPHVAAANAKAIAKTALGAEINVPHSHYESAVEALSHFRHNHYHIAALEQAEGSQSLFNYQPPARLALILGNEVEGVTPHLLAASDTILELPMLGSKESLNVSVAAGIAIYQLRFGIKPV